MQILKDEKVLLVGDSVTDCGRARPVGEGNNGLGNGYPMYFHAMLDSTYPQAHIRVLNTGISGNTSRDLRQRFQEDVLAYNPQWVSIMIGINDIWRQYDRPLSPESHVYPDEYRENIRWMIRAALQQAKGVFLVSPVYMEQNHADEMRGTTDKYQEILKELVQPGKVFYVDAQKDVDSYLKHYPAISVTWDRVHPNHVVSYIIAKALFEAVEGCDGLKRE